MAGRLDITGASARKARDFSKFPSDRALHLAELAATKVYKRSAPVRRYFIRARGEQPSPLAQLLRGGQSGEVRLKLYLSIIWIAAKEPHQTDFTASSWAALLDLPDPDRLGARRIRDAIHWMEDRDLLRADRRAGYQPVLYLLDDAGRGEPYQQPGSVGGVENRYFKVPATFWTNGWLVALSGTAVALLLIAFDQEMEQGNPPGPYTWWLSPTLRKKHYCFGRDTWSRAEAELVHHGILEVSHAPVDDSTFGMRRVRNVYSPDLSRLSSPPRSP